MTNICCFQRLKHEDCDVLLLSDSKLNLCQLWEILWCNHELPAWCTVNEIMMCLFEWLNKLAVITLPENISRQENWLTDVKVYLKTFCRICRSVLFCENSLAVTRLGFPADKREITDRLSWNTFTLWRKPSLMTCTPNGQPIQETAQPITERVGGVQGLLHFHSHLNSKLKTEEITRRKIPQTF